MYQSDGKCPDSACPSQPWKTASLGYHMPRYFDTIISGYSATREAGAVAAQVPVEQRKNGLYAHLDSTIS